MASMKWLKKRKRWQIRWHVTIKQGVAIGRIIKGSKTFRKKQAAEAFKTEIEQRRDYLAAGMQRPPEPISVAVENWYKSIHSFTKRTQYLYQKVLPKFISSLPGTVYSISQITPIHIRNYLDSMINNRRTNRTCNVHLTVIKSFCRYLAEHYDIPNPARKVKMLKEDPPNQRFLTEKEYQKTLNDADCCELYRRCAQFIANTGLRATEFCELTWACVNPQMRTITVTGKGRKRRTIPLNKTCRQILTELKPKSPNKSHSIFMSKNSKPLTHHLLRAKCLQTAAKAGIEKFGPHSLRHFFATQLIVKGVNISFVSKLLGHSSIRVTEQTYIHILSEHLKGVTNCLV